MIIIGQEIRFVMKQPRIAGNWANRCSWCNPMMLLTGCQVVIETISNEGKRGLLYISNGEICHAQCGEFEGEEAAYSALNLKTGFFTSLPWVPPKKKTINRSAQMILMEAARKRDEDDNALYNNIKPLFWAGLVLVMLSEFDVTSNDSASIVLNEEDRRVTGAPTSIKKAPSKC